MALPGTAVGKSFHVPPWFVDRKMPPSVATYRTGNVPPVPGTAKRQSTAISVKKVAALVVSVVPRTVRVLVKRASFPVTSLSRTQLGAAALGAGGWDTPRAG